METNGDDRELLDAALETLPMNTAVLDTDGTIRATKCAWRDVAVSSTLQAGPETRGGSYLAALDDADSVHASRAAAGIRAVLHGERERFDLTYPCHATDEQRWFELRAAPFTRAGDRYVTVAHVDITARKAREQALRDAYEISASDRPLPQQVDALLELGRELLGLEFGTLSYVQDDEYVFEAVATPVGADLAEGDTAPLETLPNCERVVETAEALVLRDVAAETPELMGSEWGITAYLGAPVVVDDEVYGTFCFYSTEARAEEFTDWEVTFVELLSNWVSNALERRRYTDLLTALDSAFPDLAFLIDADGTYLDYLARPELSDLLVGAPDELPGQTLRGVLPAETADLLLATVRETIDTGELQTVEYELDVPAGSRWFEARVVPFAPDSYGPDSVVFVARDVTERKKREQALHATTGYLRAIITASPEPIIALDREGTVQLWNDAAEDVFGYSTAEAVGEPLSALELHPELTSFEDRFERTLAGESFTDLEVQRQTKDGERVHLNISTAPVRDADGATTGIMAVAKDVTEHKKREQTYQRLTERIADAYYAFDSDWTVTYWNDSVAARIGIPAAEIVGKNFWDVFPELEGTRYEDTLREAMESQEKQSCEFYYDEGDYWVDIQAYPDDAGISVISQEITERKKREQELTRRRDELAQLNRLNTLTRELVQALQDTASREAVETAICDRLTDSALYQGAWIGVRGATMTGDQTVIPQTAAGVDAAYLDDIPALEGPARTAVQTGDVQVVDDLSTAVEVPDARQQHALEYGHHALAAVPLTTGEATYGVLVVYPPDDQTISDGEQTVLADLGQMIAQAIQRIHSQQALSAETVVLLDLRLPDTDLVFGEISTEFDCELALERWVSTSDGGALYYLSVHDADPERVSAFLRETPLECDCTVVREAGDDRPPLLELRFDDQPRLPIDVLGNYGGSMTTARIADGDLSLGVELPPGVNVRSVVDALREVVPTVELISKQYVDRPSKTAPALQNQITAQLTPKQEATLEAAYVRGYYAWPRDTTMEELAETFDVSAPTLHYRLRKAHQTIVTALVDGT